MTHLSLAFLLASLLAQPASAAHTGFAATHRSLEKVARIRGMDSSGVLFASPIAPLGTRLCVSSKRHPEPMCGTVTDIPQPRHRAWQIRTGRIVEVQPAVARLLCADPAGLPRQCPVSVTIERNGP